MEILKRIESEHNAFAHTRGIIAKLTEVFQLEQGSKPRSGPLTKYRNPVLSTREEVLRKTKPPTAKPMARAVPIFHRRWR